jgi:uncharacterized membrane protein YvbJ
MAWHYVALLVKVLVTEGLMGWRCLDCGNKASKKFPAGRCPACDSFNVQGKSSKAKNPNERSEQRKKIDVTILLVCWGSLALLLIAKIF